MKHPVMYILISALLAFACAPHFAHAKTRAEKKSAASSSELPKTPQGETSIYTLPTYEALIALPKEQQENYLVGLKYLVDELAQFEEANGVEYEILGKSASFDFVRFILNEARAKVEEKSCIYAGWLSLMDFNNKYCTSPKSEGCVQGSVQCNPLLFGSGVCTPRGNRATSTCIRNAKPIDAVRQDLASKKSEWDEFKKDLGTYCERGRQEQVCAMIAGRLRQIEGVNSASGGKAPAPAPKRAAASGAAPAARARSAEAAPARNRAAATSDEPAPPAPRAGGRCDPFDLVEQLDLPTENRVEHETLMSISEAQAIYCNRSAPDRGTFESYRKRVAEKFTMLARSNMPDRDKRYHRSYLTNIQNSLEACVSEAMQGSQRRQPTGVRAIGEIINAQPGSALLQVPSRGISSITSIGHMGRTLNFKGLTICDVVDNRGVARPTYANPAPAPAAQGPVRLYQPNAPSAPRPSGGGGGWNGDGHNSVR